jgi:hypothetical protein
MKYFRVYKVEEKLHMGGGGCEEKVEYHWPIKYCPYSLCAMTNEH